VAIKGCKVGTFKSAATSSSSEAAIVLAKQPEYRGVFCAMLMFHMAYLCWCFTWRIYAGVSHGVCLSCVCNAEAQLCHRAAMPIQAAVEHLELAGPNTHKVILPTVIICMP